MNLINIDNYYINPNHVTTVRCAHYSSGDPSQIVIELANGATVVIKGDDERLAEVVKELGGNSLSAQLCAAQKECIQMRGELRAVAKWAFNGHLFKAEGSRIYAILKPWSDMKDE